MRTAYIYSACIAIIQLFITGISNAQTINLTPAPAGVIIDGNAAEWGSLPYSNNKAKISYTLSNDKNNLYLVLKTKDSVQAGSILATGITFGINTKGKKSTNYTVTFPAGRDRRQSIGDPSQYMNLDPAQIQAKIASTKYRNIGVTGFKDIPESQISTSNPYGIQAAISYDDAGYLVYEEAIPLTLFHAAETDNKAWAFNIEVNGLELKPNVVVVRVNKSQSDAAGGGNSGSFPGRTGNTNTVSPQISDPSPDVHLTPSYDFWVKFILAKMP